MEFVRSSPIDDFILVMEYYPSYLSLSPMHPTLLSFSVYTMHLTRRKKSRARGFGSKLYHMACVHRLAAT